MHLLRAFFRFAAFFTFITLLIGSSPATFAQSKPQKSEAPSGNGKRNTRPAPMTEEERKKAEEEKKRAEEEKNAEFDPTIEKVESKIVNVDTVVYNKKTGQVVTGLKKENFAIFENGVKQNISSFATPESPITVTLILEYSRWTETFGSANGGRFEPGFYEVVKPVAQFLTHFIKPPNDYASVIAFDIRPTPLTDFTNDPARLNEVVNLLLRNSPAFRENALFDSLKLALVGGKADSVVLENSKSETAEYAGMADLRAKRKAILLVASGIDTFSKTSYDDVRHMIQEAGVPIYIISTGNLFFKKYEQYLGPLDDPFGGPGRMTFLQAKNTLDTFAKESGGVHYPMTFESEAPGYLQSIDTLLRNQYSLAYDLAEGHQPGKKYKIEVKVDVDGDGQYDDKAFVVQHRPYYTVPKPQMKKP
jgi:Ca-activated chloride channel family protein